MADGYVSEFFYLESLSIVKNSSFDVVMDKWI